MKWLTTGGWTSAVSLLPPFAHYAVIFRWLAWSLLCIFILKGFSEMKGDNEAPIILVTVCLCHSPQTSATSPANATPALGLLIKTPVSHLLGSDHCVISSSTLASLPDCALPCDHSLALFLPLTLDLPDSPPYGAFPWAPYRPRFQASWVQAKMLCQRSRPLVGQGVTAHTTVHSSDSFKEVKNKNETAVCFLSSVR